MREHDLLDALAGVLLEDAVADVAHLTEATRTMGAGSMVTSARSRFLQDWMGALGDFHAELLEINDGRDPLTGKTLTREDRALALNAAGRRLESRWHDTIETGHLEGWRLGHAFRGARAPDDLSDAIRETIDRQRAFASRYVSDLVTGRAAQPGAMGMAARGGMYAETVEGSFHRGAADAGAPGEQIWWRLGEAEHCIWTPEARVLTKRGEIPIVDVVPGDEVFTHRARWRRVLSTHAVPLAETTASPDAFVVRSSAGGCVGLTADHKVWTLDGWLPVSLLESVRAHVLESVHASTLRQMFGDAALAGPYDVPSLPLRLRLRQAEVAQVGDMHEVHGAREECGERGSHVGPRPARAAACSGQGVGRAAAHSARGPDGGELPAAHVAEPAVLRGLLGRGRQAAHDPAVPLALGAGERAHPRRNGAAPPERGLDGRPLGESRTVAGLDAQAPASPHGWGLGQQPTNGVRHLRRDVQGRAAEGHEDRAALLRASVPGCLAAHAASASDPEGVRGLLGTVRDEAAPGCDEALLLADLCTPGEAPATGGIAYAFGRLSPTAVLYDITVEEDHSFVVEGILVSNCPDCPTLAACSPYTRETLPTTPRAGHSACRSRCKCFLEFRTAPAPTPQEPRDRRPLDQALIEPGTAPPGYRVPTDAEAAVLRDLEMRMNHARRQIAATRGTPEQRDWIRQRKDLNRQIIEFNRARGTYSVPRFRVEDVINGVDVEQQHLDRMFMRGIDGTTVHQASAREISRQLDDAVADLRALLDDLPPDAPAIPNLAAELDRLGAPPVTPPPRPRPPGSPPPPPPPAAPPPPAPASPPPAYTPPAPVPPANRREALALRRALTGRSLVEDVERPPVPAGTAVVNVVARSGRQALLAHVEAIRTLAADGPFAVEVGPADEDWAPLVLGAGTWVRGEIDEVRRFIAAWRARARGADLQEAPWQLHA